MERFSPLRLTERCSGEQEERGGGGGGLAESQQGEERETWRTKGKYKNKGVCIDGAER